MCPKDLFYIVERLVNVMPRQVGGAETLNPRNPKNLGDMAEFAVP